MKRGWSWGVFLVLAVAVAQGCAIPQGAYKNMVRYDPQMAPGMVDLNVRVEARHEMSSEIYSLWKAWGNPDSNIEGYKNAVAEVAEEDIKRSALFRSVYGQYDGAFGDVTLKITTRDEKPGGEYAVKVEALMVDPYTGAEVARYQASQTVSMNGFKDGYRNTIAQIKTRIYTDYQMGKFNTVLAARQQRMAAGGGYMPQPGGVQQGYPQQQQGYAPQQQAGAVIGGGLVQAQPQYQQYPQQQYPQQQQAYAAPAPMPAPVAQAAAPAADIPAPRTGASNRDAMAVVIGNRDYKNKDIPSVDYALNDAEAVKQYLIKTLGYQEGNIVHIKNASKAEFEAVFGTRGDHRGKLYNYLKRGKSDIFIYYSGHGAPDPASHQGYFVPADADPQVIGITGYSLELLYANIARIASEMQAPNTFIVIDSCFSGATERGLLLKNVSPITIQVKNPVPEVPGAVVLTSSLGTEVSSWYPEKGHGMFTYFFLKALKERAEKGSASVTANDIFKAVSDETEGVPYYARRLNSRVQTPQIMGDKEKPFFKK